MSRKCVLHFAVFRESFWRKQPWALLLNYGESVIRRSSRRTFSSEEREVHRDWNKKKHKTIDGEKDGRHCWNIANQKKCQARGTWSYQGSDENLDFTPFMVEAH